MKTITREEAKQILNKNIGKSCMFGAYTKGEVIEDIIDKELIDSIDDKDECFIEIVDADICIAGDKDAKILRIINDETDFACVIE